MNKQKRIDQILELLDINGEVTVKEACEKFSASPATIRRDFNFLSKKKVVTKSWGGIMTRTEHPILDSMTPVSHRKTEHLEEKRVIARQAASLIEDGDVIIIDGGSTTLEMAPFLANRNLKIITNSLLMAQNIDELNTQYGAEVFLTGGLLYPLSGLLVGPQASDTLRNFHAKWLFLSTGGISLKGVTNSNVLVVETEKTMMEQSERVVILADHSKIGKNDLVKLCDLKDLDILITNNNSKAIKVLEDIGNTDIEVQFV